MIKRSHCLKQVGLVGLCFIVGVIGIANAIVIRTLPIDLAESRGKVIVDRIQINGISKDLPIRQGDIIVRMDGREVHSLAEARWEWDRLPPYETVDFLCQRGDSVFAAGLVADYPASVSHIILTAFVGLAFLILGLSVWWLGIGDPTVAAFLRLNVVTGIAILLESESNIFVSTVIHDVYSLVWMVCYVLIPAAFVDFVVRFSSMLYPRLKRFTLLLYLPPSLLIVALGTLFISASKTRDPIFISLYEMSLHTGLGVLLLIYFLTGFLLLADAWLRSSRPEERNRNRWLLLCTLVGVAPFILLYILPRLMGGPSVISFDQSMFFLPVAPIGWGMAVASFRLLRVERTLSRTIVYVASAGIVLYAMIILFTYGAGERTPHSLGALTALIIVGVFIAYLAGLSLAKGIRSVVDRVYYGDWYSFRDAVRNLSNRLSGSMLEQDIVSILTERLPDLLRIEKAILLIRGEDDRWALLPQRHAPVATEFTDTLTSLENLLLESGDETRAVSVPRNHPLAIWGVAAILPLVHADRIMGCLLLGRKESQSPYSVRDFQLLNALSSFSGMAIANLELHHELVARECRVVAADLAGGIAHEINNALYPLKGQAQLMQRSVSEESGHLSEQKLAHAADIVVEMTDKIQRIADNLNRLSEPIRPKKTHVNLNDIAENAIQILSETAGRIKRFQSDNPKAPFQLRRNYDPDLPHIEADSGQINQVFINLILNAADAMEAMSHGVLTVGTVLSASGDSVVGYVEDTGIGIPQEYLKKIFQPYFTTKTKGKGTGLGLGIVRSIIEIHDGKLDISSEEGHGTRVEFSLPVLTSSSPTA
jgi:signal transduction histidine kinase